MIHSAGERREYLATEVAEGTVGSRLRRGGRQLGRFSRRNGYGVVAVRFGNLCGLFQ